MKRIGVAFPGNPSRPTTWSGTPSGVLRGLAEVGVEAVAIEAQPSPVLRTAAFGALTAAYLRPRRDVMAAIRTGRAAARVSPLLGSINSWATPRRVREAGRLDGIIQIGTGYSLATDVPVATFEDMTVAQTKVYDYPGWQVISARGYEARVARQRRAYDQAVACCVTSRWAAESVIRDYAIVPEKVHVVGVGRNRGAAEVQHDWSRPRFLFVGLDYQGKNGDAVVRAFTQLHQEQPEARLDVVGAHPPLDVAGVTGHGPLRLGVPDEQARLERLFAEATCFVMPSHAEAAGIAYVEAAAAGLPSIGTTAGGSEHLIGDGGLTVDPRDDDGLLAAMRRLADPATAAQMGAVAKQRSREFTWAQVAQRLLRALSGETAVAE